MNPTAYASRIGVCTEDDCVHASVEVQAQKIIQAAEALTACPTVHLPSSRTISFRIVGVFAFGFIPSEDASLDPFVEVCVNVGSRCPDWVSVFSTPGGWARETSGFRPFSVPFWAQVFPLWAEVHRVREASAQAEAVQRQIQRDLDLDTAMRVVRTNTP